MHVTKEQGVKSESQMFFSSTTAIGMNLFYYPICAGHFFCQKDYLVERKQHYSILIMQIIKGKCYVETDFTTKIAGEGDTVIIDCWLPHKYQAKSDDLETIWLHIDGGNCRELCKEVVNQNGNVFQIDLSKKIYEQIETVYQMLASKYDCPEAVISPLLYTMFCSCFAPTYNAEKSFEKRDTISLSAEAKAYIYNHLNSKITVKELSEIVHLSPSQFSKLFKEQTGFSPYDYVLLARLTKAKELLLETDRNVSEIALETGFQTDCNFTTFFTSSAGMSPSKFRREHRVLRKKTSTCKVISTTDNFDI